MNYRKIYLKIVKNALVQNRKKYQGIYFELHHILPKSLFPKWAKRKSNLVLLTAREHFFCHQLLDKIYPGEKMFLALWIMANDGRHNYCVKGSKEYERLRIRCADLTSEKMKRKPGFFLNHTHREESKIQSSKSVRNYWKGKNRVAHNKSNNPKILNIGPAEKREKLRRAQGNIITCLETGEIFFGFQSLLMKLSDPPGVSSLKRWLNSRKEIEGRHYIVEHRPRKKPPQYP